MNKSTFKSIGAVLAGFIAVFILSVGTDTLLVKLAIFPPQNQPGSYLWWMLMLALIYRCIYAVVGGYVTAALAPSAALRHAIVLGMIGFVFALLGSISNWNKSSTSTAWYPILLIILTLPSVWSGGKLQSSLEAKKS